MSNYLVVATEDELLLPWAKSNLCQRDVIITGVGGSNVIKALRNIPKDSDILNVGYCGSSYYPIGEDIWIHATRLWHPNVDFAEPVFFLDNDGASVCLTAGDFVTAGEGLPDRAVVDMELAYIAAFGFKRIRSVKRVSDNLNYLQYKNRLPMKK